MTYEDSTRAEMYATAARAAGAKSHNPTSRAGRARSKKCDHAFHRGIAVDGADVHELDETTTALRMGSLRDRRVGETLARLADEFGGDDR